MSASTRVSATKASASRAAAVTSPELSRWASSCALVCRTVSGARNSCEASATNRRCSANAWARGRTERRATNTTTATAPRIPTRAAKPSATHSRAWSAWIGAMSISTTTRPTARSTTRARYVRPPVSNSVNPAGPSSSGTPASPPRDVETCPSVSRSANSIPGGGSPASSAVSATAVNRSVISRVCVRTSTTASTTPTTSNRTARAADAWIAAILPARFTTLKSAAGMEVLFTPDRTDNPHRARYGSLPYRAFAANNGH